MKAQPLRVWMAAVIAAPAIVLAGAGVAAAQQSSASATPDAAASVPSAAPAAPGAQVPPPERGRGSAGVVHHHHHHHHHGPRGGQLGMMGVKPDANGNVTRADVQAAQQRQLAMFDKIDANGDGQLSKDERSAFHRQMREAHPRKGSAPTSPAAPPPAAPKG